MAYAVQGVELMRKELTFRDWCCKFDVRSDDKEECFYVFCNDKLL